LPELRVQGLSNVDARAVLKAALRSPLDPAVLDGIVAEARGNPLTLLELPRGRTPAEIAFGFGLPSTLRPRMEEGFVRQLQPVPPETRRFLLLAAVDPIGDVILLWGPSSWLRRPTLIPAVGRHRAQASPGPDEEIATELDRSADRARARRARGGSSLPRAGGDADTRPGPSGDAGTGRSAGQAPRPASSIRHRSSSSVESGPLDDRLHARIALLRAQIAFAAERTDEAPRLLLSAAARLEPLDVGLARETYLDAFAAAIFVGRLTGDPGLRQVAQAVRRAPTHRQRKRH
jgi:hypothetical protein